MDTAQEATYKLDLRSIIVSALLGAVIGGTSSYLVINKQLKEIIKTTPPIAVIDLPSISMAVSKEYPSNERYEEKMMDVQNNIATLAQRGFLVLNQNAVAGLPAELIIPSDIITSKKD